MNRVRTNTTKAKHNRNTAAGRDNYVYGTAAPALNGYSARRMPRTTTDERTRQDVMKTREKAHHMSAGYVLFLFTALCAAGIILVNYIQLQADLTTLSKQVTAAESQLNTMKMINDEEYNRIVNSVNLEEIRRIAVEELGMVYAQADQIITYENEGRDYMRQVSRED